MKKSPSREVNNALVEKFPPFYGTRICLTVFTAACWRGGVSKLRKIDPIHIIPQHLFKIHFIIVLPFLNQRLPRKLFLSCLLTKILCAFLFSLMRSSCSTHLLFFNFIIFVPCGEVYKFESSLLSSFLQPPVTSVLLWRNIPLITLCSNILGLYSSFDVIAIPYIADYSSRYGFKYFRVLVLKHQAAWQMTLGRRVANIPEFNVFLISS